MANKTIYPYGTDGQLPSSIGIINDLITGGADKALSAEQGKVLGEMLLGGRGTFADAYDKARANTTQFFPWLLEDVDEDGDSITKMIWHVGSKKFIDAIGADIDGTKNGLTVTTTQACDMKINGTTVQLSVGENNFSPSELNLVSNNTISTITSLYFYESGTETEKKSYITGIDFGNIPLRINAVSMNNFSNLESVKRTYLMATSYFAYSFSSNKVIEVVLKGTMDVPYVGFFPTCSRLKKVDASDLTVSGMSNKNATGQLFNNCTSLQEADIRKFNTSQAKNWYLFFQNCPSLKKLTIGEGFSNEGMTTKTTAFGSTTNADLFIVSTTPPALKNCTFTEGAANDEHGLTYDWLSYTDNNIETCRFRAIYVPDEAVDIYKTNVYVDGGTVGNTGWSYYADIIKPMSEYVE